MYPIIAQPSAPLSTTGWSQTGSQLDSTAQTRAFGYDRTDQEWSITTREGDVVTLNIAQESAAVYGSDAKLSVETGSVMNANGRLDYTSASFSHREWSAQSSSKTITMTVEGDLSKEELRDIRKAIQGVAKMMRNALMGRPTDGHLNRLTQLDTLAEIDYSVEREQVRYTSQTMDSTALIYGANGQLDGHPRFPDETPTPSNAVNDDDLARHAADRLSATGISYQRFADAITRLFESLREELREHHSDRLSRARHIENALWRHLADSDD